MLLSLLGLELRTGQGVPRGADAEEKLSCHTHMPLLLLFPVPRPRLTLLGERGSLCAVVPAPLLS